MSCKQVYFIASTLLSAGLFAGCAENKLDIDPRANDALRGMSRAIGGSNSFSFRTLCVMDEPVGPGQTGQFSREARIVVHRPDRLFGEGKEGDGVFDFWYQGRTLTVLERPKNVTATVEVPGRIDEMLDMAAKQYGLTVPLADFLFSDPYKTLTADVQSGRYVGQNDVDGAKCHHLLFTQELIDWQIWIDTASPALPRKFAIDYKLVPGRPQFTALFSDWNLKAAAGDDVFKPVIPEGATKVDIGALLRAAEKGA